MKKITFLQELIASLTVLRNRCHPDRLSYMGDSDLVKQNNATFLFLSNVIKEGTSFRCQRWTPTTLRATIPASSDTADKAVTITHEIPLIRDDDSSDITLDNNATFVKKIFPFVDLLIQSGQHLLDPRWMRWFINLSLAGDRDGTFCDDLKYDSTTHLKLQTTTTTFDPVPQLVLKKYLNISIIDSSLIPLSLPSIRANIATLAKYSKYVNFYIVNSDAGGESGENGDNDTTDIDYIFDHTFYNNNNNTTTTTSTSTTIKPTIKLGVHFEKEEILKKINNVL